MGGQGDDLIGRAFEEFAVDGKAAMHTEIADLNASRTMLNAHMEEDFTLSQSTQSLVPYKRSAQSL